MMRRIVMSVAIASVLLVNQLPSRAQATGQAAWAIDLWSTRYGVNSASMEAVAQCESGMDPTAYNASSGASGLFQFLPQTFYWLRDQGLNQDTAYVAGDFYESRDVTSVGAQAHVAVWAFAHGYGYLWSCA